VRKCPHCILPFVPQKVFNVVAEIQVVVENGDIDEARGW
jgi:hypothetical protein